MNGAPFWLTPSGLDSIIKVVTTGTTVVGVDGTGVGSATSNICAAYDGLYERRKLMWIKLNARPFYKNFIANPTGGTLAEGSGSIAEGYGELFPPSIYMVSDNNGTNVSITGMTVPSMMANITGVKRGAINRPWKIFRRGLKMPLSPKYTQAVPDPSNGINSHPSGQWLSVTDAQVAEANDHFVLLSDALPNVAANLPVFDVMYEMKFMWYDAKTVTSA